MTRANLDIVVLDLNQIPAELKYDLQTIWYDGILSSADLTHLAHLAAQREQRDADRLAEVLYG